LPMGAIAEVGEDLRKVLGGLNLEENRTSL